MDLACEIDYRPCRHVKGLSDLLAQRLPARKIRLKPEETFSASGTFVLGPSHLTAKFLKEIKQNGGGPLRSEAFVTVQSLASGRAQGGDKEISAEYLKVLSGSA